VTGTSGWASPYFKFNADSPHCSDSLDIHDGITCTDDVEVRRVAFHGAEPSDKFRLQKAYLTRIGDTTTGPLTDTALDDHMAIPENWDDIDNKPK